MSKQKRENTAASGENNDRQRPENGGIHLW